ncbi:MAG TPA: diguanylate cyclase, partial [Dongiaceae bacterium]|nr:diguanylate cyclase [Dongiaceae bacterium]
MRHPTQAHHFHPVRCRPSARWAGLVLLSTATVTTTAFSEQIEILYEPSVATQAESGQWLWLAASLVLLVAIAASLFFLRLHRILQHKDEQLRQFEARLREAQLVARIGSWSRDFETGETFWSDEACRVLELGDQSQEYRHYERLIHPDDSERVMEVIAAAYHQGGSYQCDHRVICPGGKEKYIRLAGQVFLGEGSAPVRETGTVQDISDRRMADIALQRSEARLRSIMDATPYPIVILENASGFPVLYANRSTFQLFQLSPATLPDELKSLDLWADTKEREAFFNQVIREKNVNNLEVQLRRTGGQPIWVQLSGRLMDFAGTQALFVAVVDITERYQARLELERLATTDALTGLLNNRSFLESANRELKRALRYRLPFTLLMLDIDYFKRINDSYGRTFGDHAICRFGEVVRSCLREEDVLGRISGEEFGVVLASAEEEGGYRVAERIRKRWQEEVFEFEGARFNFTVSIGVARMQEGNDTVSTVVERADAGLHRAKRAGRNCVIVHS